MEQNLKRIDVVSAVHVGSVSDVLRTLHECEEIELTPEQVAMGRDIIDTNRLSHAFVAPWYLVRFGMLIERQRQKKSRPDGANI